MIKSSDLNNIEGIDLRLDVDLAKYSTTRLRTNGNILIVKSEEALSKVLPKLNSLGIHYHYVGIGANQILSGDKIVLYLKLDFTFDRNYLSDQRDEYVLPASVPLSLLTAHAKKFNLNKWQYMTGIPATIAGAAFMNAGISDGEVGELIKSVRVMDIEGNIREVVIDDSSFSYRQNHFVNKGEAIVSVVLKNFGENKQISKIIDDYLEHRTKTQPWKDKTCGCVFKNISTTCRAGHHIDILNIKGLTYKGIKISELHGNFFINKGDASFEAFQEFVEIVQKELYLQFGKKFELEVKII